MKLGKILLVGLLSVIMALLVMGCAATDREGQAARPGGAGQATAIQEETPTPLPTLVAEEDAPTMIQVFGMGLLMVCGMIVLMVFGIVAAVWMVSLRLKIKI